ncbi:hypothetical protein [Paenibacillus alvei]|uniref:hypothetical protein n=1 Tax=Paenibacillus alvei TaxID=44250 RepID=UPI0018CE734F|nr:hypothetical protein [Paenibacillus alvei]MCY9583025.1 hypothetical protein [Paenibacillus alvei]MCY9588382.1 hypothetical protein [Paenibacillus alvei]
MELIIESSLEKRTNEDEFFIPDIELDDEVAILMSICEVFESSQIVTFIVSGFGQTKWPVDCRTDLATIIEQVPEILEKIRRGGYAFQLDFYEQGIERQLVFEEDNSMVKVTCISRTHWAPSPSSIFMEKAEVSTMFESLYGNFLEFSKFLCTELANHTLLKEWEK